MKDRLWSDGASRRDVVLAMVTFLATVLLSSGLGKIAPHTHATAAASAAAAAAGTVAIGLILARRAVYPRWSFVGAAVLLALASLMSLFVVPDPERWMNDARTSLWLNPWCLIVLGLTPSRGARGACATESPRAGWLLLGAAAAYAALSWVALLVDRLF